MGVGHSFGDEGLTCLAKSFQQMASLKTLGLARCHFGESGLETLSPLLPQLEAVALPNALEETVAGKEATKIWTDQGKKVVVTTWPVGCGNIFKLCLLWVD